MKIQHDFHIHTTLSLCANETATVDNYLNIAKNIGLKKLGFANHFWDERIEGANDFYQLQNYQHLSLLKSEIEKINNNDVKIYFGCEAEYDSYNHGVAITEEVAEKFDYILVPNSHTHMVMPKDCYLPYHKHVDFMIQAYEEIVDSNVSRYITAMAHPFEAVACPYDNNILVDSISDDIFKRLFDKTANKGIAVEINVGIVQSKTIDEIETSPYTRMWRIARDSGCKFIFGSDAHDNKKHNIYYKADILAKILELDEGHIADIAL